VGVAPPEDNGQIAPSLTATALREVAVNKALGMILIALSVAVLRG